MPLSYKEKGLHTRTVRTHGLVTQYCGNGALSDLDSGITAFNLFNTKFLEGLHPSHEHRVAGYQHRRRGDNAVLNFPDNGTHSGVLGAQMQQMPDLQRVVRAALSSESGLVIWR